MIEGRSGLLGDRSFNAPMTVVTRNVADFQGTGVALLDPWQWSGTT